jgi:hypothetical protein
MLIDQADHTGGGLLALGLHGEADLISPLETVRERYPARW